MSSSSISRELDELAVQTRHGVPIGSWWLLQESHQWDSAILRVDEFSYWGNPDGTLQLFIYVGINSDKDALVKRLDRLNVSEFWQLADVGKLTRIDSPPNNGS